MGTFRIKPNDPYLDFFNQSEDPLQGDPYDPIPQETLDLRASKQIPEPSFWDNLGKSFSEDPFINTPFTQSIVHHGGEFANFLKQAVTHPIDTAGAVLKSPAESAMRGLDQAIGVAQGVPEGFPAESRDFVQEYTPELTPGPAEGLEAGLKVGLPVAAPGSEIFARPVGNIAKGDVQEGLGELAVLGAGGALLHKAGGGLVEGLKEIPNLAKKVEPHLPFDYSADPGMNLGNLKKYQKGSYQGQEVKILGRRGNSVKIELPDGTSKTVGFSSLGDKAVNQLEVPKGKYEDIVKELEALSGEENSETQTSQVSVEPPPPPSNRLLPMDASVGIGDSLDQFPTYDTEPTFINDKPKSWAIQEVERLRKERSLEIPSDKSLAQTIGEKEVKVPTDPIGDEKLLDSIVAKEQDIPFAKEDVSSPHIIDQLSDLEKSFSPDEIPTIDPQDVSIVLPDKNIIPEYASFNKVGRPGKQGPIRPKSSVPPKPPIEPPNTGGGNDGGGEIPPESPEILGSGEGKKPETLGQWAVDIYRLFPSLKASGDIPALSHARYDTLAHPIQAIKRLKTSAKAVFSEAEQARVFEEMSNDPMFKESLKAGTEYHKQGYDPGAQSFGSWTAENALGPVSSIVKGSERGQNVYLSKAKFDRFKQLMEDGGYKNFDQDPKAVKYIADLANISMGYGKGKTVAREKIIQGLNTVMWSVRKRVARAQHLKMFAQAINPASDMPPVVRKELFRQAIPTITIGLSLLKLAEKAGATVDWDSDNSNWLKARFPTASGKFIAWSPFGDYTGLLKLGSQFIHHRKVTDKGEYDLDDPKNPMAPTKKSILQDYAYYAMNPSSRMLWDGLVKPETELDGSPFVDIDEHPNASKALQAVTPINVGNQKELYDELGPMSSLFAPFITAGENIDVYDPEKWDKEKARIREEKGLPPKVPRQNRRAGTRRGKVLSTY